MKLKIDIDIDNDAFILNEINELSLDEIDRCLKQVIPQISKNPRLDSIINEGKIFDSNGNSVGLWKIQR